MLNVSKQKDLSSYQGADASWKDRPGVPRETSPHPLPGAHWTVPERQPVDTPVLVRAGLDRPTPVFSTALPPKGLSGAIRTLAMSIPDHRVSHVALQLFADRVDAFENLLPVRMIARLFERR